MKEIVTNSALETIELGFKIGKELKPGDVVLLDGDLGAGKTTFTKGIGQALNIKKTINSPTFTIMKMYQGDTNLYHLDLYRLNGSGNDFDLEEYIFSDAISVIEWPNQARDILPSDYLYINIKIGEEGKRIFTFTANNNYEKILEVL